MWSFLSDLARDLHATYTVVVMDTDRTKPARQYRVRPRRLAYLWGGSLLAVGLVVAALLAFTPLRTFIPGYATDAMRQEARLNAMRAAALQDSLRMQRQYMERLQNLITGRVGPEGPDEASSPAPEPPPSPPRRTPDAPAPHSRNWADHRQPAVSMSSLPPGGPASASFSGTAEPAVLSGLSFPVRPPVENGFPTRGFDARTGHYAVDIAVSKGTLVRSIGDGYVIVSDWTQDGGYTVAVQHADGYLSVYKHNQRLLKQVGDHVRANEAVAVSGNTGEITTGPHLHFELWRHGLAQDPRSFVAGW
jgi:murein DD-endopeptidase MepM/ murein hydrolase activator NlpD